MTITRNQKQLAVIWGLAIILGVVASIQFYIITTPKVGATPISDKCYTNCTDPTRPSYDGWGNEWDYLGNIMHATCPNVNDPISDQPNPECVCQPTQYIQGYDKETNVVVCHDSEANACPYADAQQIGSAVCDKLTAEAQAQTASPEATSTPDTSYLSTPILGK